jgi:hypothetical protein
LKKRGKVNGAHHTKETIRDAAAFGKVDKSREKSTSAFSSSLTQEAVLSLAETDAKEKALMDPVRISFQNVISGPKARWTSFGISALRKRGLSKKNFFENQGEAEPIALVDKSIALGKQQGPVQSTSSSPMDRKRNQRKDFPPTTTENAAKDAEEHTDCNADQRTSVKDFPAKADKKATTGKDPGRDFQGGGKKK